MAQRRMMSLDIIDTDAFLDMPTSSQLLYFHLNARADDDGFVANPKKICRMLGANNDDMKVLISKKFLIAFEDGVCVIKHWRINNFIRKDVYRETKYLDLKRTLFVRPNGVYTQTSDDRAVKIPEGHFSLEHVNEALTEREPSIGKDRLGEGSKEEAALSKKEKPFVIPTTMEVQVYCLDRKNSVDAEAFVDFYSSKDWKIGRNKMRDWRAAVRTWEARQKPQKNKQLASKYSQYE